ncbi:universal stress protein [Aneurinibacillus sp. Ricciae_BoGa-3]|uniref:universal stress protein n=1 Tax=Aneurinibacillus sp. Ricciae_BoGa-3 TaxID=3022697 RepID=UPI0023405769|nr:universal stress protein [Aneurinibacillus sp. Ricciae_BoGa-3]WCK53354.1 universal stress protein [Aneurinibacillus sp. Ricciae_BoGa-3]
MFDKIVVAIDGSILSQKALDAAIELGKGRSASLSLLHVVKEIVIPPYVMGEMAFITREYDEDFTAALRKEGEELLDIAKERVHKAGLTAEAHVITGDPASVILDFSKENHMQLIVMGSRGLGTFKEMMLGSVSHRVSQVSECPVLIVK